MNEGEFSRQDIMPRLRQWGAASRLESATENGIPDILYSMHGFHGLIESKVLHSGGKIYFTKFQPAWLKRHWFVTQGDIWIFVTDGETVFIYTVPQALEAPRLLQGDWLVAKFAEFPPPTIAIPRKGSWDEVHQVLLRHK